MGIQRVFQLAPNMQHWVMKENISKKKFSEFVFFNNIRILIKLTI